MNAIGASLAVLLAVPILLGSRRWALMGMMAGVLYLPQSQAVDLLGVNLFATRLLELVLFVRILTRGEFRSLALNDGDRAFLLVYSYTAFIYVLRAESGHAFAVGQMIDAVIFYFSFRILISDCDELVRLLRSFVFLLLPFAALVFTEMATGTNPFSLMGSGVFVFRGDRLRCMGSFRHPSLLGALGATFLPLYVGLYFTRNNAIRALTGIGLCLALVFLANSGGPLSGVAIGLLAWAFWKIRKNMSAVRKAIVFGLAAIALVMNAPIWYLPAKISLFSGGDGWHRSRLMEVAFQAIDQWWLFGMEFKLTWDWFPYAVVASGGADITNYFLAFGLDAGLLAMILFIVLLVRSFRLLGRAMAIVRVPASATDKREYMLWGLGCMLVVHVFTWFGITYFDQMSIVLFMQLAAIVSVSQAVISAGPDAVSDRQPAWSNPLSMSSERQAR